MLESALNDLNLSIRSTSWSICISRLRSATLTCILRQTSAGLPSSARHKQEGHLLWEQTFSRLKEEVPGGWTWPRRGGCGS